MTMTIQIELQFQLDPNNIKYILAFNSSLMTKLIMFYVDTHYNVLLLLYF